MSAPLGNIVDRLAEKRFIRFRKTGALKMRFLFPREFSVLPIRDLIIRYRSIMNGFYNYFSFADNKPRLRRIHWILKESLIKAIGDRKGVGRREVIKSMGEDVALKIRRKNGEVVTLDFKAPAFNPTPFKFLGALPPRDPLAVVD